MRPGTLASVVLTAAILVLAAEMTRQMLATGGDWFQDYNYYRDIGAKWLATGALYLPRQLAGPYDVALMVDVLYPPIALALFVPFVWLPAVLWWTIPLGVLTYVVASLRPAPWSWPVMALCVLWPRTIGAVLFGNTDMWVAAAVAGAIRWGWPATLVVLKPTFAPLALIAILDRRAWITAIVLAFASLPMLPLWLDYLTAMQHLRIGLDYSLGSLPFALISVVAMLAQQADRDRAMARGLGTRRQDSRPAMGPQPR